MVSVFGVCFADLIASLFVILDVPDYYDIIKQPMDLSTIKKKLDRKQYKSPKEFKDDLDLMFRNCYFYNPPDNFVVKLAHKFQAVVDKELKKIEPLIEYSENEAPLEPTELKIERKDQIKLRNQIRQMNGTCL